MGVHQSKFDFGVAYALVQNVTDAVARDNSSFIRAHGVYTLTYQGCVDAFHGGGYRKYAAADIINRLLTWKVPFLQLWFFFQRPPLAWHCQIFSLVHLLGDPIDSIASLLYTLSFCQQAALQMKELVDSSEIGSHGDSSVNGAGGSNGDRANGDRTITHDNGNGASSNDSSTTKYDYKLPTWRELTLILVSWSECGEVGDVKEFLKATMYELNTELESNAVRKLRQRKLVCEVLRELARSLASDRSTKFLPLIFSQTAFAAVFLLQLGRTGSAPIGPNNWIPIEVHSVAFSELFLWLIYAVFLSAVIGVSQTELEIPRQLNQARWRLEELNWLVPQLPAQVEKKKVKYDLRNMEVVARKPVPSSSVQTAYTPSGNSSALVNAVNKTDKARTAKPSAPKRNELDHKMRILSGGMYHCRPALHMKKSGITKRTKFRFIATACLIVILAVVPGLVMSGLVPPEHALSTRNACQLGIFGFWFISALSDLWLAKCTTMHYLPYRRMFVKDVFFTFCVISVILVTQIGVLNSCHSWTNWGTGPLVIPQLQPYADIIDQRIKAGGAWLVTTWLGIITQLVFCAWTFVYYLPAMRVYLQRDDGQSNLRWLEKWRALLDLGGWLERKRRRLTRENKIPWTSVLIGMFFDQHRTRNNRGKRNTSQVEKGASRTSSTDLAELSQSSGESYLMSGGIGSRVEEPEEI